MVSIIVSSVNDEVFNNLHENIKQTAKDEVYEIIKISNHNEMGICAAYNVGASKAIFENLCFIHEDVMFHNRGWVKKLTEILEDSSVGIVGLAGGTYKSRKVSTAWHNGELHINLIQHKGNKKFHWSEPQNYGREIADVLIVDGVFLGMRKSVWMRCKFDEKILTGFHFYDMDISLSIQQLGLRVCVTYEILLEHFSFGKNNREWLLEAEIVHKKWRSKLPWSSKVYTLDEKKNFEFVAAIHLIKLSLNDDEQGFYSKFRAIISFITVKPLSWITYKMLKLIIFK